MKRIVNFEYNDGFVFTDANTEEELLNINPDSYILEANEIYLNFFENIKEVPNFDFHNKYKEDDINSNQNRMAKFIFDEVKDIVDKICKEIEENVTFVEKEELQDITSVASNDV